VVATRGFSDFAEAKQFLNVWDEACKGARGSIDGLGKSKKVVKHEWCLSEALKRRDRKFLLRAKVISLARDERKRRLLVRFRGVAMSNNKCSVRSGVLGQVKHFGSGAECIANATRDVVKRALTVELDMPPGGSPFRLLCCSCLRSSLRNN